VGTATMEAARDLARVRATAAEVILRAGRRGRDVTGLMRDLYAIMDRERKACDER
jgi:hypothetical protein